MKMRLRVTRRYDTDRIFWHSDKRVSDAAGDAVGTLWCLLSTISALSRPPYRLGFFKAAVNVVVAEERALPWPCGLTGRYEP